MKKPLGNDFFLFLLGSLLDWEPRNTLRKMTRFQPRLLGRKRQQAVRPRRISCLKKNTKKLNNLVLLNQATYNKLVKKVLTYKLITPSIVSKRMKVQGYLAPQDFPWSSSWGFDQAIGFPQCPEHHTRLIKENEEIEAKKLQLQKKISRQWLNILCSTDILWQMLKAPPLKSSGLYIDRVRLNHQT